MNRAEISIMLDRYHNVVLRVYTAWKEDAREYIEVKMPAKDARQSGLELMNKAELAEYLESRGK